MRVLIRPCYLNFNKWLSIERPEIGMVSPDIIYSPDSHAVPVLDVLSFGRVCTAHRYTYI